MDDGRQFWPLKAVSRPRALSPIPNFRLALAQRHFWSGWRLVWNEERRLKSGCSSLRTRCTALQTLHTSLQILRTPLRRVRTPVEPLRTTYAPISHPYVSTADLYTSISRRGEVLPRAVGQSALRALIPRGHVSLSRGLPHGGNEPLASPFAALTAFLWGRRAGGRHKKRPDREAPAGASRWLQHEVRAIHSRGPLSKPGKYVCGSAMDA